MSIKIKIRKTCVNKEYEVKNKNGTGPKTTALVRGIYWGGFFLVGGMSKSLASWGTHPIPPVGKTVPSKQMPFVTISNKNIFFKIWGIKLGAIATPKKRSRIDPEVCSLWVMLNKSTWYHYFFKKISKLD